MVIINGLSFSDKYQGLNQAFISFFFFFYHVEVSELLLCLWIKKYCHLFFAFRSVLVLLAGSSPWLGWRGDVDATIPGCLRQQHPDEKNWKMLMTDNRACLAEQSQRGSRAPGGPVCMCVCACVSKCVREPVR